MHSAERPKSCAHRVGHQHSETAPYFHGAFVRSAHADSCGAVMRGCTGSLVCTVALACLQEASPGGSTLRRQRFSEEEGTRKMFKCML